VLPQHDDVVVIIARVVESGGMSMSRRKEIVFARCDEESSLITASNFKNSP
jgi:hypothetical protein